MKVAAEPMPSELPLLVQPEQPPPANVVTTAAGTHGENDGDGDGDGVRVGDMLGDGERDLMSDALDEIDDV